MGHRLNCTGVETVVFNLREGKGSSSCTLLVTGPAHGDRKCWASAAEQLNTDGGNLTIKGFSCKNLIEAG